jgi:hypothetical protein
MYEALGSIPSPGGKKKKNDRRHSLRKEAILSETLNNIGAKYIKKKV